MQNVKLNQLEEKLDKRINQIKLENKNREIDKLDINKDKVSGSGNYDKINKNMVIGDNSVCLLYTSCG